VLLIACKEVFIGGPVAVSGPLLSEEGAVNHGG
jgi:hypothetical protein